MAKQRKFRDRTLSQKHLINLQESFEMVFKYTGEIGERQDKLLKFLEKVGPKRFTWILANILIEKEIDKNFTPDPKYYPELRKRLDGIRRKGYRTDSDLLVSRVENNKRTYDIRISLPLRANIKEYLPAIKQYQDYFLSISTPLTFQEYVFNRYSDPTEKISSQKLIEEINQGIKDWVQGNFTELNMFGLDDYLRDKGFTPEKCQKNEDLLFKALFNENKLRRLIKYQRTGK